VNDSTPGPPRPNENTVRVPSSGVHSSGRAFWRILTSFDHGAMVPVRTALRNSVGMVLSLTLGIVAPIPFGGPAAGCGALFVSYSDGSDPYRNRARRMVAASITIALAGLIGGLSAQLHAGAAVIAAVLAFIVGMAAAYGKPAMDVGTVSLVMFTIFSGQPFTSRGLLDATLLALTGGLVQVVLSIALWPVRRYEPERQALALLYRDLGRIAAKPISSGDSPPATARASQVQQSLRSSLQDSDEESLRYQSLLNQAERARLCLITLLRMHAEIAGKAPGGDAEMILARFLSLAGQAMTEIGRSLAGDGARAARPGERAALGEAIDAWRVAVSDRASASEGMAMTDTLHQMDALAGQLRAAESLASGLEPDVAPAWTFGRQRAERRSLATTFRANLNLRSTVFRHALRLSVCLTAAGLLAAITGWRHSYWIPMTVILVLRPDFAATFSRGLQRIAGTILGLVGATALFYCLPPAFAVQAAAIGTCVFFLRRFGHANYAFLALCVTAAIVLMLGLSGAAPNEVVPERLADTLIGGTLALSAYALWPTREPADDALAKLLAAYRDYFTAVVRPTPASQRHLAGPDHPRLAARLARSNLEASVERLAAEPATKASTIDLLHSMIASSHRLVHAIMGIDAADTQGTPSPSPPGVERFIDAVRLTFLGLEAAMRGDRTTSADIPNLRDAFHAMSAAADEQPGSLRLRTEGDTLVNSLNTLSEQILRWRDTEGSSIH
jgi:uncharacterized membrane protein YccC